MQLGFDLAGNRGAVLDNLCTGSREETRQFLCFRGDIDASQATVREVNGQFLGIATIRLDLSLAATAMDAGLTTMLVIPVLVRARCSTKAENPPHMPNTMWLREPPQQTDGKTRGSAWTVAVFTICLWHTHVTVYVSLCTSTPT